MKCHQKDCDDDAVIVVYWPGESPPPKYCLTHANKAVLVARAMGLTVHAEVIDEG